MTHISISHWGMFPDNIEPVLESQFQEGWPFFVTPKEMEQIKRFSPADLSSCRLIRELA